MLKAFAFAVFASLVVWTQPAQAEAWSYGEGGLCTPQNTFFGQSPEEVAKQYTAARVACDPPSYNEYFMYCDPPHRVLNNRTRTFTAGSTFCYTHRTLDFDPDVALGYGVTKQCFPREIDTSFQCVCPSGTVAENGRCVARSPCADCVTKDQVIALAEKRAKAQGYDIRKLTFDAKWNGKVWYVTVNSDTNTPGSRFAYEFSRKGKFVKVRGGA